MVFCLLKQQGAKVVGIHDRPLPPHELSPELLPDILIDDFCSASALIAAGILEAQTLVLAGSDDAKNLAALTQARVLNPAFGSSIACSTPAWAIASTKLCPIISP